MASCAVTLHAGSGIELGKAGTQCCARCMKMPPYSVGGNSERRSDLGARLPVHIEHHHNNPLARRQTLDGRRKARAELARLGVPMRIIGRRMLRLIERFRRTNPRRLVLIEPDIDQQPEEPWTERVAGRESVELLDRAQASVLQKIFGIGS